MPLRGRFELGKSLGDVLSQSEDVSRESVGQLHGSSDGGCPEDNSAISRNFLHASGLTDATGDNARLLRERRELFRWLDTFGNRWLGVANKMMVKQWLLQENRDCLLCRKLAEDLSQIIRNFSVTNALGVLFSVGSLVYAVILGYYMKRLEAVVPGKEGDAMLSFGIAVGVMIAFAWIFFYIHVHDSDRRNRLAFELMKFSNSAPSEYDVPCALHRMSCGRKAAPTPRDDSHKGQASQEG